MARHGDKVGPRDRARAVGRALVGARARALMSIGIVLGLGAVGTMAAWNDTSTATSGTFTTGRIDIKAGTPAVDNNPPAFTTALASPNLVQGTTVSAPLVITNSGTVPFTYTIKATGSNATLGAVLNTIVYAGTACSGTALSTITQVVGTKTFAGVNRSIGAGGTDQLCFSVTVPTGVALPDPAQTGTIAYTFDATSA